MTQPLPDPAMFTPLTSAENTTLTNHLNSSLAKQAAVDPSLSGPWSDTQALISDLDVAYLVAPDAEPEAEPG